MGQGDYNVDKLLFCIKYNSYFYYEVLYIYFTLIISSDFHICNE